MNHSFDPISSLAQMSQQLTSCVSLNNNSVNNNSGSAGGGMGGVMSDMNMTSNLNQNMDGVMMSMDGTMEHCSPGTNNSGQMGSGIGGPNGMPGFGLNGGPCHMNSMLGSMGQRLMNSKMCATGYNAGVPGNCGGVRENPSNYHGVMPPHRMMGRMVNFTNFNISSNVQVKASTPNTIQYMPVRPHNNNGSNIRVPPSLEFLQRYTNPQMQCNIFEQGAGNRSDPNKLGANIPNSPGSLGPNHAGGGGPGGFFPNFNQVDQDEIAANQMPHDINFGSVRGVRPMRMHSIPPGNNTGAGPGSVTGPRMQSPLVGNASSQFVGGGSNQDMLECQEPNIFNAGQSGAQLYPGDPKMTTSKGITAICQNLNSPNPNNLNPNNGTILQNEHNQMQSSVSGNSALGPNNNMIGSMNACVGNNNPNYKSFVGPNSASSDLKYAQQYHSFQQQLYATSTRSQQGNVGMGNNNSNPAFFVNK